jgi:hypothetical protein
MTRIGFILLSYDFDLIINISNELASISCLSGMSFQISYAILSIMRKTECFSFVFFVGILLALS